MSITFNHNLSLTCTDLLDNVITFRKSDATIKLATFEAEPSGDIWFQFKTTAPDGVMLHNIGASLDGVSDFIQVRLDSKFTVETQNIQLILILPSRQILYRSILFRPCLMKNIYYI